MGVIEPLSTDEARLFLKEDGLYDHVIAAGSGIVAVHSERGPEKSSSNEDAAAIIGAGRARVVLAVADGLGGAPAGARAASVALKALSKSVRSSAKRDADLRDGILDGFEAANRQILELGVGAATTLTAVAIEGDTVRAYNAGDSFMVATGNRGKIKRQTIPHSPTGYALEAGLIDEKEAMHHEERHLVSNMLGSPEMRIDVGAPFKMRPRDTLVLASDGVSDNLLASEIVELVRKGPLERAAKGLATKARQRMIDPAPGKPSKPDDLTFLIFRLA